MSSLQYFDYEGFGERSKRDLNYSQAVRIDNRIEISGQGGWDRITEEYPKDLGDEVDQAFDNIEHALKQAGGTGLDQVYKLRVYITESMETSFEPLIRNLKGRAGFKNHGPLLTVVQVKGLYSVMRIEIEAEAFLG
ncbi:YjgF-like protein [Ophiobolus disseminans]|uniref:YjgF-like protein n=1 Tax=Ophiobolus disseminans TaxID=1469910 RepID=A0A6A6ZP65_9PLEO|nr:YjgF-like protein [Ophiobolus disseminans]